MGLSLSNMFATQVNFKIMYKRALILVFLTLFLSCNKENILDNNLKKIIIEYQRKYPIPDSNMVGYKSKMYIYVVSFQVVKKDTVLRLTRSSNGLLPDLKGYGIFQDEVLKPTFIYDANEFSRKFVFDRIKNNSVDKYYINPKVISEGQPPIYTYSVKNKNINLVKIDTFWNRWD